MDFDDRSEIHVHPLDDLREHVLDGHDCGCIPFDGPPTSNGYPVIVHNSWDGREILERAKHYSAGATS